MYSLPRSSRRCSTSVRAHGWMSSGLRSAAMLREYFGEIFVHSPERSGLPSAVRGAGAVRFGLPSAVRGIPAVGWFNHWAEAEPVRSRKVEKYRSGKVEARKSRSRQVEPNRDRRLRMRYKLLLQFS